MSTAKTGTKAELEAWRARWEAVNRFEIEELRRTPAAIKVRQAAAVLLSTRALGWDKALSKDDQAVWDLWNRLREASGV